MCSLVNYNKVNKHVIDTQRSKSHLCATSKTHFLTLKYNCLDFYGKHFFAILYGFWGEGVT